MQCHANSFTWIESHWTLRDGENSLIGISNLFTHFLWTENYLYRSFGTIRCSLIMKCLLPVEEDWAVWSAMRWCKCQSIDHITYITLYCPKRPVHTFFRPEITFPAGKRSEDYATALASSSVHKSWSWICMPNEIEFAGCEIELYGLMKVSRCQV